MPLVTTKVILDKANRKGCAVPAFDVIDHASAEGVVEAAQAVERPVILMFPEAALNLVNHDAFFPFLVRLAERASVPVALELDHGQKLEAIMKAIQSGFTAVMIDGSSFPLSENIALTKKITEIAHAAGVCVEAEIGHVAGGEGAFDGSYVDTSLFTRPTEARKFVDETGVDALAVAIGTVHGVYKGEPKLNFELLGEIKRTVSLPLVLHGGSGVSEEDFIKCIKGGINKINLFTEISMAAVGQSLIYCKQKDNKLHFVEMILAGKQKVFKIASKYLETFGNVGKG